MHPLPLPLLHSIYASAGVSIVVVAFALAAIALGASPLFWIIPVSFCITSPHYILIFFLARTETSGSSRLFSALNVSWAFITAVLWTAATVVSIVASILQARGSHPEHEMRVGMWILIVSSALSLVECGLTWGIAVLKRKERKKITYAAKWRFNPTSSSLSSLTWRS
ncbi:hypothetical protein K435DRAFT_774065 [Dendrothele bispora CBS 962.96]|uniref:MARVEL domain-containing protein n=1 Tax=Dendrothele bispora (strain CBS 962.96) TaxID=1314807 RepID=A0A4V4HI29_DENBC|nr:hypothetical protein K435DRAFT_774065 [Dendrothele bispora CBS 962.96]